MKTPTQNPAGWLTKNAAWLIVNAVAVVWMVMLVVLSLNSGWTTVASGPGRQGGGGMLLNVSGEDAQHMLLLAAAHTALVGHGAPTDLIILAVLLAVCIPAVRQWIQSLRQPSALATVPTAR